MKNQLEIELEENRKLRTDELSVIIGWMLREEDRGARNATSINFLFFKVIVRLTN